MFARFFPMGFNYLSRAGVVKHAFHDLFPPICVHGRTNPGVDILYVRILSSKGLAVWTYSLPCLSQDASTGKERLDTRVIGGHSSPKLCATINWHIKIPVRAQPQRRKRHGFFPPQVAEKVNLKRAMDLQGLIDLSRQRGTILGFLENNPISVLKHGNWTESKFHKRARRFYSSLPGSHRATSNIKVKDCSEEIQVPIKCVGLVEDSQKSLSTRTLSSQATPAEDKVVAPPGPPKFWSHRQYKGDDGNDIMVHYCKSLKSTEEVARHFLHDKILGFDLEWKAQASGWGSIQDNVSVIQLANKNRIALFQISQFRPAKSREHLVSPSLQRILECSDITKVGVSIKADCTRLRKYLGINPRGIFELSHLFKLVKYCQSDPSRINKRPVSLSEQVEEHFGLPLAKHDDVRCSDWTSALDYRQVQYAATDPYACIRLFGIMNAKRRALDPSPPLPALVDYNLPIRVVRDTSDPSDLQDGEALESESGSDEPEEQSASK